MTSDPRIEQAAELLYNEYTHSIGRFATSTQRPRWIAFTEHIASVLSAPVTMPTREDVARTLARTRFARRGVSVEEITPDDITALLPDADAVLDLMPGRTEREVHHEGYELARQDVVSGAFVSGPTYEAVRDSATGRRIQVEALLSAATELEAYSASPTPSLDAMVVAWLRARAGGAVAEPPPSSTTH